MNHRLYLRSVIYDSDDGSVRLFGAINFVQKCRAEFTTYSVHIPGDVPQAVRRSMCGTLAHPLFGIGGSNWYQFRFGNNHNLWKFQCAQPPHERPHVSVTSDEDRDRVRRPHKRANSSAYLVGRSQRDGTEPCVIVGMHPASHFLLDLCWHVVAYGTGGVPGDSFRRHRMARTA